MAQPKALLRCSHCKGAGSNAVGVCVCGEQDPHPCPSQRGFGRLWGSNKAESFSF